MAASAALESPDEAQRVAALARLAPVPPSAVPALAALAASATSPAELAALLSLSKEIQNVPADDALPFWRECAATAIARALAVPALLPVALKTCSYLVSGVSALATQHLMPLVTKLSMTLASAQVRAVPVALTADLSNSLCTIGEKRTLGDRVRLTDPIWNALRVLPAFMPVGPLAPLELLPRLLTAHERTQSQPEQRSILTSAILKALEVLRSLPPALNQIFSLLESIEAAVGLAPLATLLQDQVSRAKAEVVIIGVNQAALRAPTVALRVLPIVLASLPACLVPLLLLKISTLLPTYFDEFRKATFLTLLRAPHLTDAILSLALTRHALLAILVRQVLAASPSRTLARILCVIKAIAHDCVQRGLSNSLRRLLHLLWPRIAHDHAALTAALPASVLPVATDTMLKKAMAVVLRSPSPPPAPIALLGRNAAVLTNADANQVASRCLELVKTSALQASSRTGLLSLLATIVSRVPSGLPAIEVFPTTCALPRALEAFTRASHRTLPALCELTQSPRWRCCALSISSLYALIAAPPPSGDLSFPDPVAQILLAYAKNELTPAETCDPNDSLRDATKFLALFLREGSAGSHADSLLGYAVGAQGKDAEVALSGWLAQDALDAALRDIGMTRM